MRIFAVFLALFLTAYAFSEKERDTLLRVIQGLYQDRVYNIAAKKCEEYLEKASENDPYREKVIKVLFHSLYNAKDKKGFLAALNTVSGYKLSPDIAEEIFTLGMKLFDKEPAGQAEVVRFYIDYTDGYRKKQLYLLLAKLYTEAKLWDRILKLPDYKELNFYKVIALYKMGRYDDLINFTEEMAKFLPEDKDNVMYYRGLAFFKKGDIKKAVSIIESVTFKTPEMVKFLSDYYIKEKNYLKAERYLRILSLENGYKDYAYYYLGVIYDLDKKYKKASQYYKKASQFKTKYGQLARKRLLQLKEAGVIEGEKFYSVRIILYSDKIRAENLIRKKSLTDCFVKKYKKYYAVYCGMFKNRADAQKERKLLKKKGFKDAVIDTIIR
ncbi:MAG: hypothetical protein GXO05_01005 [Aquificae bacterium]|nr:hypothetical protein [Aquificota bacterium]